jgi:hypothetical protein
MLDNPPLGHKGQSMSVSFLFSPEKAEYKKTGALRSLRLSGEKLLQYRFVWLRSSIE